MIKLNRKVLNIIAFSVLIVLSLLTSNFEFYLYVLIFPLAGSIYVLVKEYENQSVKRKRNLKAVYLVVRIIGLAVVSSFVGINDVVILILYLLVLIPLVLLEMFIVFDISFGNEDYVNWFIYLLNVVLHIVAIILFYNALQYIAFFIVALLMMILGTIVSI